MPKHINYIIIDSALGFLLIAGTDKGICSVKIGKTKDQLLNEFLPEFTNDNLTQDQTPLNQWINPLQNYLTGKQNWPLLPYDIEQTPFQRKVRNWLYSIPSGKTYTYSETANAIGMPNATRAVANACASNPVPLIIPCHRILPKSGKIGGFRFGSSIKEKLLLLEKS